MSASVDSATRDVSPDGPMSRQVDESSGVGLRRRRFAVNALAAFGGLFPLRIVAAWGFMKMKRWVFDIWYVTPFVILPWMYAVNRRKWNR